LRKAAPAVSVGRAVDAARVNVERAVDVHPVDAGDRTIEKR
jgi:hypothetical protein